jgi:RND superfamily putative drug exporter
MTSRRARFTVIVSTIAIGAWGAAGLGVEDRLHRTDTKIGGTASAQASAVAKRYFGESHTLVVLIAGPERMVRRAGRALAGRLEARHRVKVLGPWIPGAEDALHPAPGRELLLLRADATFEQVSSKIAPAVRADLRRDLPRPLRGYLSGYPDIANGINEASIDALKRAELIAGPLLLIILLAVFRSPLAAAIPLVLGLATIAAAGGVLRVVNAMTPLDAVALNMATMFGLALGVDYSLLIVSRFREERRRGLDATSAAAIASATAGRTVRFAGLTLGLAMAAATLVAPGTLLLSGGIGTVVAVVISVLTATVALPAFLARGPNLERWRIGGDTDESNRLAVFLNAATRRPLVVGSVIGALLVALSLPAVAISLGVPDPRVLPRSRSERTDFDAIRQAVKPGWLAPYEIIAVARRAAITAPANLARLDRWQDELARDPMVRTVLGPAALYRRAQRSRRSVRQAERALRRGRGGLARMSSGLSQVDRGFDDLRQGLSEASTAATRAAEGGGDAAVAVTQLQRALRKARGGSRRLSSVAEAILRGARALRSRTRIAASGARRLESGTHKASAASARGATDVARLAAQLTDGAVALDRLRDPAREADVALSRARHALESFGAVAKLDPRYRQAYADVLRASSALSGRDPSGASVAPGYRGLEAELEVAAAKTREAADALSGPQARLLLSEMSRLRRGAASLADGLGSLDAGAKRLSASLAELRLGTATLDRGLGAISDGDQPLRMGIARLRRESQRLAGELTHGRAESRPLAAGVARAREGATSLRRSSAGLEALTGGSGKRIVDSSYFTLAGLDVATRRERVAAGFSVNLDAGGAATRLVVIPRGDPTRANDPLRRRIQDQARTLGENAGIDAVVGGPAAQLQDFSHASAHGIWLLLLVLGGVSYVVLVVVLRSLMLPLVAVSLNLLTVAAALGVLTLLFEGAAPLGGPGKLDAITVRAILSIVFALSIDYAVFLIARMREGYERTGDTNLAIAYGLTTTARVVTGAALIMVGVFAAFALSPVTNMRALGVGLAVAVIVDATVVRLLLLPAAMRLLGAANWWLPSVLTSRLPRLNVDPEPSR